jgi:hypothetical protein
MSAGGVGLVAPGLHAYPALQFTHTVAPAREYLPAAQAVALGELLPAAHKYLHHTHQQQCHRVPQHREGSLWEWALK